MLDGRICDTWYFSLFPSLSAEKTSKAVRNQFVKSKVEWSNVDWRLVTLYIKLNEPFWTNDRLYNEIKKYLPKRITNLGRPPSIGTRNVEKKFCWPQAVDFLTLSAMGFWHVIAAWGGGIPQDPQSVDGRRHV